jgi:hypothetical protein
VLIVFEIRFLIASSIVVVIVGTSLSGSASVNVGSLVVNNGEQKAGQESGELLILASGEVGI